MADAPIVARGLGRVVEADLRMRSPQRHPWSRAILHHGGRAVCVAWQRDVTQGLHSIEVRYDADAVRVGIHVGTRPGFWGISALVIMQLIVEHAVIPLREPLGGRPLEVLL